jgi:hypothetical protein
MLLFFDLKSLNFNWCRPSKVQHLKLSRFRSVTFDNIARPNINIYQKLCFWSAIWSNYIISPNIFEMMSFYQFYYVNFTKKKTFTLLSYAGALLQMFLLKLIFCFYVFILFWCVNIKNKFIYILFWYIFNQKNTYKKSLS